MSTLDPKYISQIIQVIERLHGKYAWTYWFPHGWFEFSTHTTIVKATISIVTGTKGGLVICCLCSFCCYIVFHSDTCDVWVDLILRIIIFITLMQKLFASIFVDLTISSCLVLFDHLKWINGNKWNITVGDKGIHTSITDWKRQKRDSTKSPGQDKWDVEIKWVQFVYFLWKK